MEVKSFKVNLVGDAEVGKSSLLRRLGNPNDSLETKYSQTIGIDFAPYYLSVGDEKVKLQIWDSSGDGRFNTITSAYYRGCHALLLVYDVTNRSSFEHIGTKWIKEVGQSCRVVLIANKIDRIEERVVSAEEGKDSGKQAGSTVHGNIGVCQHKCPRSFPVDPSIRFTIQGEANHCGHRCHCTGSHCHWKYERRNRRTLKMNMCPPKWILNVPNQRGTVPLCFTKCHCLQSCD